MNPSSKLLTIVALLTLGLFSACAGPPGPTPSGPRQLEACFYNLNEVYSNRVYRCLKNIPGVFSINRSWNQCRGRETCLCYELLYDGPIDELIFNLRKRLPTSKTIPFRCRAAGENRLEVIFDGGFK